MFLEWLGLGTGFIRVSLLRCGRELAFTLDLNGFKPIAKGSYCEKILGILFELAV